MRQARWARPQLKLIALGIAATALHCDPGVLVKVKIREIPAGTSSLSVMTSINPNTHIAGMTYLPYSPENFQVNDQATEIIIGLTFPRMTSGSLKIAVSPMDDAGVIVKDMKCNVNYFGSSTIELIGAEVKADVDIDPAYISMIPAEFQQERLDALAIYGLDISSINMVNTVDISDNILQWTGCGWNGTAKISSVPLYGITTSASNETWVGGGSGPPGTIAIFHKMPPSQLWMISTPPANLAGKINKIKADLQINPMAVGRIEYNSGQPIVWIQWDNTQWNSISYPVTNYAQHTNAIEKFNLYTNWFISVGQNITSADISKSGYVRGNIVLINNTSVQNDFIYPWNQAPVELLALAGVPNSNLLWLGGQDYLASWNGSTTTMPGFGSDPVLTNVAVVKSLPSSVKVTAIWVPASPPNTAYATLVDHAGMTDLIQVTDGVVSNLLPSPLSNTMHALSGTDLGNGDVDLWLVGDNEIRFRYTRIAGRVQSTLFMLPN